MQTYWIKVSRYELLQFSFLTCFQEFGCTLTSECQVWFRVHLKNKLRPPHETVSPGFCSLSSESWGEKLLLRGDNNSTVWAWTVICTVRRTSTSSSFMPARKAIWSPATAPQMAGQAACSTEEPLPSSALQTVGELLLSKAMRATRIGDVPISIKQPRLLCKAHRHPYSLDPNGALVFMGRQ